MSDDCKRLKNSRKSIKAQVTRFKTYVEQIDSNLENVDIEQLQLRLEKTQNCWEEFENIQISIEELKVDEIDAGDTTEEQQRESFQTVYFAAVGKARHILATAASQRIESSLQHAAQRTSESQQVAQIKYPQINLPIFNGSYSEWLNFYDTFNSLVHNNIHLSKIEKFHYLKSCLKNEAAKVIQALEISSSNYETAWSLLKERFQNKRLIINNHVKGLFDITPITKESAVAIRQLIDNTNTHLRALESLQQPTESWDTLIIHIITSKLDSYTRRSWETSIQKDDIPTLQNLLDFLSSRAQVLESLYGSQQQSGKLFKEMNVNKPRNTAAYLTNSIANFPYCKKEHGIYHCEDFLTLSISERIKQIKSLKLCLNCLRKGHMSNDCKSRKCRHCDKRHNSLLHLTEEKPTSDKDKETTTTVSTLASNSCQTSNQILLSTAIIFIQDSEGNQHKARALLDSGSHLNFITKDLSERLKLKKIKIDQAVNGISQALIHINYRTKTQIKSQYNGFAAQLDFYILPKITEDLPPYRINLSQLEIPKTINLADPTYNNPAAVDILIGSELFWNLLCVGQITLGKNMPIAQKTKLGWILAGPVQYPNQNNKASCFLTTQQLNDKVEELWKLESQATQYSAPILSTEEACCEDHFNKNITRDKDGKFVVKLPLKQDRNNLGNSSELATTRFYNLEKKLKSKSEIKRQYQNFMEEYLSLGHIEKVEDNKTEEINFYLPHHAVLKQDSITTKLRVVFDGSAKTDSGLSLNDIQMVGPTVQPDLFTILIRFRMHNIALTADIEKMYRMVKVHQDDTDLQRIIWRGSVDQPLTTFRLLTVTYGTASASYLATRCLVKVAEEISHTQPVISKIIKENIYVDDLLTGFETSAEAQAIQQELQATLSSYGFKLRKWCSNDTKLTNQIQQHETEHEIIDLNKQESIKTLGMIWQPSQDIFKYTIKSNTSKITKRSILAEIASIFYPPGLLSPVIIIARIILQQIWQQKLEWDEALPMNLHTMWEKYKQELFFLNSIKINRKVITIADSDKIEIHGFSDASERAFGACIYIKATNTSNQVSVNLLCAKTRVAPLKQQSLPRLELCAAALLAQLYTKIKTTLQIEHNAYFWTDSKITLSWLNGSPSQWQTFVANRVSQIQELVNPNKWNHVKSEENPADILTRGSTPKQMQHLTLWWNGPQWLEESSETWQIDQQLPKELPEAKKSFTFTFTATLEFSFFKKYSSLHKLLRVTAYIIRFINNFTPKHERQGGVLTVNELENASNILIKQMQTQTFIKEYNSLLNGQQINKDSKLLSLNPFIDKQGIIRVGGRIKHANLDFNNKHPIILVSQHPLTELIITEEHKNLMLAGCQATLASLRTRYWPIAGRSTVRKIINKCIICFRARPTQIDYLMGNLPEQRVTFTRPFYSCGIDYAGPFMIKEGSYRRKKLIKTYLCIFICLSTKAVHLELAKDLSTEAFMNCLHRFISRRGKCSIIISDNGTNFVGAKNHLIELESLLQDNHDKIANQLSKDHIQWNMIPPRAPNFGGLWEAAVKSAKFHMTRLIGTTNLTYEELNTIIIQIEGCLNSRPISPISNDPNDLSPLTPGHFLIGDSLKAIPQPDYQTKNLNSLTRYQRQLQFFKNFWERWHKDYLQQLQQRPKWKQASTTQLEVGALVVLRDDNLPPLRWRLGRITQLHPGSDGITRVISVKVQNGEIKRPVSKICLLPIIS